MMPTDGHRDLAAHERRDLEAIQARSAAAALVCPNCGGERVGTIERAEIWQSARFTVATDTDSGFEAEDGTPIDVEWDAYDSDDVGDTQTVGYFCRDCTGTWDKIDDSVPAVPFVLPEHVAKERAW